MLEPYGAIIAGVVGLFVVLFAVWIYVKFFENTALNDEIAEAQKRLDAEDHRFRIGDIDRRNLQQ
jgi:hypothetical protein